MDGLAFSKAMLICVSVKYSPEGLDVIWSCFCRPPFGALHVKGGVQFGGSHT